MSTKFITVPVIRGFSEIKELYRIVTEFGGIICGGYVRYCCSPNPKPVPASDVDIYCKNDEVFEKIKNEFQKQKKK